MSTAPSGSTVLRPDSISPTILIGAVQNFTQASQQLLDSRTVLFRGLRPGLLASHPEPHSQLRAALRDHASLAGYAEQAGDGGPRRAVAGISNRSAGDGCARRPRHTAYPGSHQAHEFRAARRPCLCSLSQQRILAQAVRRSRPEQHPRRLRLLLQLLSRTRRLSSKWVTLPTATTIPLPRHTELASPFVDLESGRFGGIKFPFVFPPTDVSPAHPDSTFNWAGAEPIGGSDYLYPHDTVPYVEEYELSFERQLGSATVLSVSYVGNEGHHLLTFVESNPGNPALCLALNQPGALSPDSPTPSCQPGRR